MKNCSLLLLVFFVCATASVAQTDSTSKRFINLPRPVANLPFTDGVVAGNTIYLSGRLGLDPKTGKVPATIEEELRNLLDGFSSVLKEAHMTMDDLVDVQVFCTDLSLYGQFNAVYRTYFSAKFPARAFLGTNALLFGAHFEIRGVAAKP